MKRNDSMLIRHLSNFGILSGAKIIEIGCGNGELTRQLSDLVGSEGIIVAVDNNGKALEVAQSKINTFKYNNVQFVESDITSFPVDMSLTEENSFDFLIGRRILMYLATPSTVIKDLSKYLKKDGIAMFQESDPTIVPASITPMPAHDKAVELIRTMLKAECAHMTMGFNLPKTLINSGLEFKQVYAEAVIQGQGEQYILSDMIKLLTHRLVDKGLATQLDIINLIENLIDESHDKSNVYISDMSFCAWAKKCSIS
ncbi:class I SAM-dependent methyltransferase [Paraglaciecola hydrolytica]|uniref:Methyltransferase domain-containing protein n=1 Tax=Paraglaciecola hydrolytica TaxID=1799789 RepID=A0A136A5D6_9ALTE|nr:class I SAM-dependent methyltransferase [Paraglaciecola hydrolytica]KXI30443.1 hypothetical protein AX660_10790 [Paraglaciecola hydrolytica]